MLYINHWLFKSFRIHLKIGCLDLADNSGLFFACQKIIVRFGKILYKFPVFHFNPQCPASHFRCIDYKKVIEHIAYYRVCRLADFNIRCVENCLTRTTADFPHFQKEFPKGEKPLQEHHRNPLSERNHTLFQ